MITITVSGRAKSGKTIVANIIAEALEKYVATVRKRNFEDKYLDDHDTGYALGAESFEIVELTERQDRPEGER